MSFHHQPAFDLNQLQRETFVKSVQFRDQVDSTNDLALSLATQPEIKTPLLVLALRQTAGRGRGSNQWWASVGSLAFSVLLDCKSQQLEVRNWPRISLAAGLAICRVLRRTAAGHDFRLKWPNDVYLGDRKVSGVLVESASTCPDRLVIGIGINVNNSLDSAPPEIQEIAASLSDVTGTQVNCTDLLTRVLLELEAQLHAVRSGTPTLLEAWQELCMLRGRTVQVDSISGSVVGVCQGIDQDGALLVETEDGSARCLAGVVSRIE